MNKTVPACDVASETGESLVMRFGERLRLALARRQRRHLDILGAVIAVSRQESARSSL